MKLCACYATNREKIYNYFSEHKQAGHSVQKRSAFFLENTLEYAHKPYIVGNYRVLQKICAADSMDLSLFVFTQLFSTVALSDARQTGAKTEFNAK